MSGVDDLFQRDQPVVAAPDRLRTVWRLLIVAIPLNLCGITCFTGVPGAILSLLAWYLADEELGRVESGALPADRRDRVSRVRLIAFVQLVFCGLTLLVTAALFGLGFYEAVVRALAELAGHPLPQPLPPPTP